jgi:hypothetical protein
MLDDFTSISCVVLITAGWFRFMKRGRDWILSWGGHHRWRGRFADKDFCDFVVDFTMVALRGAQLLATRRIFHFRGALFPKASTVTQLLTLVDIYSREKMTTVEKVTYRVVQQWWKWLPLGYLTTYYLLIIGNQTRITPQSLS